MATEKGQLNSLEKAAKIVEVTENYDVNTQEYCDVCVYNARDVALFAIELQGLFDDAEKTLRHHLGGQPNQIPLLKMDIAERDAEIARLKAELYLTERMRDEYDEENSRLRRKYGAQEQEHAKRFGQYTDEIAKLRGLLVQANDEMAKAQQWRDDVRTAWTEHEHSKFKSDGSHFQADAKMKMLLFPLINGGKE